MDCAFNKAYSTLLVILNFFYIIASFSTGMNESKAQGDAELHNNKYDCGPEPLRNIISFRTCVCDVSRGKKNCPIIG